MPTEPELPGSGVAAGPAPCTNSQCTVFKNVVQLAQGKMSLEYAGDRKNGAQSTDLWVNSLQALAERPQRPLSNLRQQHLAYGYGILNCAAREA